MNIYLKVIILWHKEIIRRVKAENEKFSCVLCVHLWWVYLGYFLTHKKSSWTWMETKCEATEEYRANSKTSVWNVFMSCSFFSHKWISSGELFKNYVKAAYDRKLSCQIIVIDALKKPAPSTYDLDLPVDLLCWSWKWTFWITYLKFCCIFLQRK